MTEGGTPQNETTSSCTALSRSNNTVWDGFYPFIQLPKLMGSGRGLVVSDGVLEQTALNTPRIGF
jgi:hypothetical protein